MLGEVLNLFLKSDRFSDTLHAADAGARPIRLHCDHTGTTYITLACSHQFRAAKEGLRLYIHTYAYYCVAVCTVNHKHRSRF